MDTKIMIGIMILLILLNNFIFVNMAITRAYDSIRVNIDSLYKCCNKHQKLLEEANPDLIKKHAEAEFGIKFVE